jgi:hypothetical protein
MALASDDPLAAQRRARDCPDDWTLYDAEGRQVARIMLVVGGPNAEVAMGL